MSAAKQLRRLKDLGQTEIKSFFHNLERNGYGRLPFLKDGTRLPELTLFQVMNLHAVRPSVVVVSREHIRQIEIYTLWRVFCLNQLEDGKSPARTAAWTELRKKIRGTVIEESQSYSPSDGNELDDHYSPLILPWSIHSSGCGSNNAQRVVKASRTEKTTKTKYVSSPRCSQCDKIGHNKRTCPKVIIQLSIHQSGHGSNNTQRVKVPRTEKTTKTKYVSSPRCGQCDKIGHNKRTCPIIARKKKRAKNSKKP